jgi:hypothetical protein
MNWLVPWHPVPADSIDDSLAQELSRECCCTHVLSGISVRAEGTRQDCDDVLFRLLDGSNRFAVVHLTFAQHPESNPLWPDTRIFASWEAFEREAMQPDHADWIGKHRKPSQRAKAEIDSFVYGIKV